MSEQNNANFLINRYNYSRRVVDHRWHHDFNYAQNKAPLTKAWLGSAKQRMIGSIMYFFGAYASGVAIVICGVGVTIDAYYRYNKPGVRPSVVNEPPKTSVGTEFLLNHGNRDRNLGTWNHNFNCWSNSKNCGRDFDWYRKTEKSE